MQISKTQLSLFFILFGEIAAIVMPNYNKIFWFFYFISIIILPYRNIFKLSNKIRFALLLVLLLAVIIIIRGFMNFNGQRMLTIIGNPAFALFELLPIFIILSVSENILKVLYQNLIVTSILGILLAFIPNSFSINELNVCFIIILAPLNVSKYKIYVLFAVLGGFIASEVNDYRLILLGIIFLIILLIINMFVKNVNILKKIAFLFFIITALLPLTLLIVGIKTGFSIYQVGEIFTIDSENGYEVDTRTFLWYEVFDDLNKNNSLIWGKGLTGRIESILSDEFDYTVTNEGRAFVEVRFLDIFRRGGLVYCIIYYCVVLFASFYAIQKSKNRFLLFVSMSIVSFYFLNFIGNQPMFNLYSVYFWIFIGMCLSDKWNGYTDTEIKYLFHIKSSRKERVYISSNVSDKEYSKILKK